MPSALQLVAIISVGYLGLVRALRWRKYDQIHRKYDHRLANEPLSPAEAQEVVQLSLGYDMHWLMIEAFSFALFKTYGIPTISKLLCATKELSTEENVARRYVDTVLLIGAWMACPINGRYPDANAGQCDPRAMISLARVNYIHSKYNISNDDYLYTLCLFLFEPIIWAEKYGWRSLSDLEKHAWFVYWVEIGRRMGIKDIPPTYDELRAWCLSYEEGHMVPSPTNYVVAQHTTNEFVMRVPAIFGLKNFAKRLAICALDERVRKAMLQDPQPWYMHAVMKGALYFVAFVQRHLMLPRRKMIGKCPVDMPTVDPDTGKVKRTHPQWFLPCPWYKPESSSLLDNLAMRVLRWAGYYRHPPGPRWKSEGFYFDELGPRRFENAGRTDVMHSAENLLGCPIAKEWWTEGSR
ncbi:hypothetical protein GGF50DRAFT_114215 [Schizophyllum commune]